MDEPQTWSKRIGLTRGKAALVGILAITLVGVMYRQYGPSEAVDATAGLVRAAAPRRVPASEPSPLDASNASGKQQDSTLAQSLSASVDNSRWKSPDLAAVLAYDPFALPPGFPRAPQAANVSQPPQDGTGNVSDASAAANQLAEAIETLRLELEQLQQRGVHVIVRGRDEYVAMIGDRTIHVGDEISGFTVTAIEPDHVRVERKVQK